MSIEQGSDGITVTHNLFHDHVRTLQVGHSDTSADTDRGRLRVTLARNHFKNVRSGISFRFGTGHVFNSLFENVDNGINTRMGADVLVERSVFEGLKEGSRAVFSADSSETGKATVVDVVFVGNTTAAVTAPAGEMHADSFPYPYDNYIWGTQYVKTTVASQAGQVLEWTTWD